jgi:hypothetical protein
VTTVLAPAAATEPSPPSSTTDAPGRRDDEAALDGGVRDTRGITAWPALATVLLALPAAGLVSVLARRRHERGRA